MKKCTMIINPNSGRYHKKFNILKIKNIFKKYDYEISIVFTEYQGHAQKLVETIDSDLIVSVGGDGTFNEVMTGNFKRKDKILLAHIPLGTANDIGAMYGYGLSFYRNIELLLKGKIKKIDICTINDRPFTYVAALGKFTNISYETPRSLKKKFGYFAYLIEGLKELKSTPNLYNINYKIDNQTYEGSFSCILISNANRIAGINNFYENIKLDDNKFEVLFCEIDNKKDILRSLYQLKDGDISTCEGFKFYKTNNLSMKFKDKLFKNWSVDGEELKDNTKNFEIKIIRNVKILIPRKNINKLFLDKE